MGKKLKKLKKNEKEYQRLLRDYEATIADYQRLRDEFAHATNVTNEANSMEWVKLAMDHMSQHDEYGNADLTRLISAILTKVLRARFPQVAKEAAKEGSDPVKSDQKAFKAEVAKHVDEAKADPASAIVKGLEAGRFTISDKVDEKIAAQIKSDRAFDEAALSIRTLIANNDFTEDQQIAVLLESLNSSGQHLRSASARRAYDQCLLYIEESAKRPLREAVVAVATRPLTAKKKR